MCYFSLSFYPIYFKPLHNDSFVLGSCAITFLSHTSCSSRCIQEFLDHYVDLSWYNDVHVEKSPWMNPDQST